jgi:nitrogen regulatory protein P-II 1
MKVIFLIMAESEHLERVVEGWRKVGLRGITILQSFGVDMELKHHGAEDSLPMFGSVVGFLRSKRQRSYTLISVVDEDYLLDEAIHAAESVIGDLTQKGKGILFVVPLDKVVGFRP